MVATATDVKLKHNSRSLNKNLKVRESIRFFANKLSFSEPEFKVTRRDSLTMAAKEHTENIMNKMDTQEVGGE